MTPSFNALIHGYPQDYDIILLHAFALDASQCFFPASYSEFVQR